jgi:hypothetical protein
MTEQKFEVVIKHVHDCIFTPEEIGLMIHEGTMLELEDVDVKEIK